MAFLVVPTSWPVGWTGPAKRQLSHIDTIMLTLVARRGELSTTLPSYPRQLVTFPLPPSLPPSTMQYELGAKMVGDGGTSTGSSTSPAMWPPCLLQLASHCHPSAQLPPASWGYTRSVWIMVAGWGTVSCVEWNGRIDLFPEDTTCCLCHCPTSTLSTPAQMPAWRERHPSERRQVRDRILREAWAESKRVQSQLLPLPQLL
jgi:hypothetical protein